MPDIFTLLTADLTHTSLDVSFDPDLDCQGIEVRMALDHWRGICGARAMPTPRELDVLHIPRRVLPHVSLLDIEYAPERRFRWRLIGTAITSVLERDVTGRYWDEIYDDAVFVPWVNTVDRVLESRAPMRFTAKAHVAGKDIYGAEHIYLPMSSDGERVDRIFNTTVFTNIVKHR